MGTDTPKRKVGRPRKTPDQKANMAEDIKCDICADGTTYKRSNKAKHCKTKIHQANLRMINLIKEARIKENNKKTMTLTELRASRYGKKIITDNKLALEEEINNLCVSSDDSGGSDYEIIEV